jgi:glycosyltransferase involved in cell wall biosynthesis
MSHQPPRVGFVIEQALGHVTHAQNLRRLVPHDDVEPVFADVEFEVDGLVAHVPGFGNWTIRSGLRARRAIRQMRAGGRLDALFVHTQVPATTIPDHLTAVPSVVSLDATPLQYDVLGEHYGHRRGKRPLEIAKRSVHRLCFSRARHLVTWSAWSKRSLVEDYAVPAEKVTVIPPGVDLERWQPQSRPTGAGREGPLRVLFVGGDFARKGGPDLLGAVCALRDQGAAIELFLVSGFCFGVSE